MFWFNILNYNMSTFKDNDDNTHDMAQSMFFFSFYLAPVNYRRGSEVGLVYRYTIYARKILKYDHCSFIVCPSILNNNDPRPCYINTVNVRYWINFVTTEYRTQLSRFLQHRLQYFHQIFVRFYFRFTRTKLMRDRQIDYVLVYIHEYINF